MFAMNVSNSDLNHFPYNVSREKEETILVKLLFAFVETRVVSLGSSHLCQ